MKPLLAKHRPKVQPVTTHSRISQLLETPTYSIEARDLDDPDEDESRDILDTTSWGNP